MTDDPDDWVTTTALLDQLHDFEGDVWRGFAGRFGPLMVEFARRGGVAAEEVEDVAQETLLAFAQAYDKGGFDRDRGGLRTWMFSIARNKIVDWHRRRGRVQRESVGDVTGFWSEVEGEQAWANWEETWERVLLELCISRARAEFKDSTFRAFELTALQGESAKVVAEQLGLTENAVFIAKHRVLGRMRELARDCEIDPVSE